VPVAQAETVGRIREEGEEPHRSNSLRIRQRLIGGVAIVPESDVQLAPLARTIHDLEASDGELSVQDRKPSGLLRIASIRRPPGSPSSRVAVLNSKSSRQTAHSLGTAPADALQDLSDQCLQTMQYWYGIGGLYATALVRRDPKACSADLAMSYVEVFWNRS